MGEGDTYSLLFQVLFSYGKPEIFNSDHGNQFTSTEFTEVLIREGIRVSMDGWGRCLDNAKMERFWWALKYEDIKLKGYESLNVCRYRPFQQASE